MARRESRFRFAPLRPADVGAVVRIERRCFDAPWSAGQFRHELKVPFSRTVVAWDDEVPGGRVAGYLCRWAVGREISLLNIAVDPDYQRRGLGRALVDMLLAEARAMAATQIVLEVREKNAAARNLYESMGFTQIGRRRDYYGKGENAVVMSLTLAPGGADEDGLCRSPDTGV